MVLEELLSFVLNPKFSYEKALNFFLRCKDLEALLDFFKKNNFPFLLEKELKKNLNLFKEKEIEVIPYNSSKFPEVLKNIKLPPFLLFLKGKIPKGFFISIVGSRKPLPESEEMAKYFTKELVKRGIVIVSGLARGIDGIAHKTSIEFGGETVAVLGSGFFKIYPPEHRNLFKKIEKRGGIISEYAPFFPPFPKNFPQRNRIIAGISRGVLIVEAGLKSGSMKTANFAVEEGRELFVVPGNAFEVKYTGSNYLIKRGAKLVQTVEDILEEFPQEEFILSEEKKEICLTEEEKKFLDVFPEGKKVNFETLALKFDLNKLYSVLTSLELKGLIERLPGNYFIKKKI